MGTAVLGGEDEQSREVHLDPHALHVAAVFAVLSRLQEGDDREAENVKKLRLYAGEDVEGVPQSEIEKIRAADPNGIFHVYPADHGFNCDERAAYDPASAQLARERTLAFLVAQLEKK